MNISNLMRLLQCTSICILFNCLFFSLNAQYNLPPDAVLKAKTSSDVDYAFKLIEIEDWQATDTKLSEAQFLIEDTESNWEELRAFPEKYAYYQKAKVFYDNLSPRVKAVLTTDELWYIYFFDQVLTERLTKF